MRTRAMLYCGVWILCMAWLWACQPPAPPVTIDQQYRELGQVGPEGTSLCSTGGVCVTFPAGAVSKNMAVQVKLGDDDGLAVGKVYELKAEVEKFAKAIEITLPVPAGQEDQELAVSFYKDGKWESVETRVGADGKTRIGTTEHFSRWALTKKCKPKPELCDGVDNDCDGQVDEGKQLCATGQACQQGKCVPVCGCRSDSDCPRNSLCVNCQCKAAPTCPTGKSQCNGACVDLQSDGQNCGACGNRCSPAATCTQGVCSGSGCRAGQTRSCGQNVGACRAGTQRCSALGQWGACVGAVTPKQEICGDGIDNDCDGQIDEMSAGCICSPGQRQPCGLDTGECSKGVQTCRAGGEWGGCVGAVEPKPESCNGKDDDCDGQTDEGCPNRCSTDADCGPGQRCQNGVCTNGTCLPGQTQCGGACVDLKTNDQHCGRCSAACPTGQVCNGGKCQVSCPGQGQCRVGETRCSAMGVISCVADPMGCGMWSSPVSCAPGETCQNGKCSSGCTPSAEVCDGKDNDCDGQVDEGCTRCQSDGDCAAGERCVNGFCVASGCGAGCPPTHVCSNKVCRPVGPCNPGQSQCGNACVDLSTDANHCGTCSTICPQGRLCRRGVCMAGPCGSGKITCGGACVDPTSDAKNCGGCGMACASGQVCTNGKCQAGGGVCTPGQRRACGSSTGACKAGAQTCTALGQWSTCQGAVTPSPEVCDGKDNDCDGQVDEGGGLCAPGQTCSAGLCR